MFLKKFFIKHFPDSKAKWWDYFKFALPVVLSGLCFSLNNFVDNFMVLNINGGAPALSFANFYTSIILAIFTGIAFVGSVLVGQYLGANNIKKTREVISLRIILSAIVVFTLLIFAYSMPDRMITLVAGKRNEINAASYDEIIKLSKDYLKYITIAWILLIWTFTSGNLLREIGLGKYSMYSTITTLLVNITFNSIFMYGMNMGVVGAALASVLARVSALTMNFIFLYWKRRELNVAPWQLFHVSSTIFIQFVKRFPSIFLSSLAVAFNTVRQIFYNSAATSNEYHLMNVAILSITATFTGIFTATFASFSANVTKYVGMHLGRSEFDIAVRNGNHLKGFHFIMQLGMSLLCSLILIALPYTSLFSSAAIENWQLSNVNVTKEVLIEVKAVYDRYLIGTLLIMLFFSPLWAWFITSARLISSGGRNNLLSILEFSTGLLQLGWLALLSLVIVGPDRWSLNVVGYYFVFFLSDIVKMAIFELVYYNIKWDRNITHEHFSLRHKKAK
ncbi:MATE family efflux transporter [Mycoplasmopsis glycophila]|uniref:Probable multidrug resistance protein NorM n=1 Tax=Mycoplasmopsis glycophila TaxID=171285 RepID=A0A449AWA0_9BACT|nr:MATE family efflux transporter [Mycoplasmopsis glycophila]VEU70928.1 MATE efflux family protein [Mycoplasmopsis glycophila]